MNRTFNEKLLRLDENLLSGISICLSSSTKYISSPFRTYLIDIIESLEPNQELAESLKTPINEAEKSRLLEMIEKWGNIIVSKGNEPYDKYFLFNGKWNPDFLAFLTRLDYIDSYSVSHVPTGAQIVGTVERLIFLEDVGNHFQENVKTIPFTYIQGKLKDEQCTPT